MLSARIAGPGVSLKGNDMNIRHSQSGTVPPSGRKRTNNELFDLWGLAKPILVLILITGALAMINQVAPPDMHSDERNRSYVGGTMAR